MASNDNKHLDSLDTMLGQLDDSRFLTSEEWGEVYRYVVYLVNLLDEQGMVYRGHSFKYGVPVSLLVTKVIRGKSMLVAFTSGITFQSCMGAFLNRLREDTVEWREDRYA
jgi:hypothetical protein